jgi:hypothetical protein
MELEFTTTSFTLAAEAIGHGHPALRPDEVEADKIYLATHSWGGRGLNIDGVNVLGPIRSDTRLSDWAKNAIESFGWIHDFDGAGWFVVDANSVFDCLFCQSKTSGSAVEVELSDGVYTVTYTGPGGYKGQYWRAFNSAFQKTAYCGPSGRLIAAYEE